MRAIDADKLDGVLENIWAHLEENGTVVNGKLSTIVQYFMGVVKNQPTVDPVKHGKWVWADDGYLRCSECTQKAPVCKQYQDEPITTATDYCPHCGAKTDLDGRNGVVA